jgi:hypothetical protein
MCLGGALEVVFQPEHRASEKGEMVHVHPYPAAVLENNAPDPLTRCPDDHFQSALLSRPPHVRWLTAESGFIEVSLRHLGYYILHVLIGYAKIFPYETITERTEKWATPTFLLVIYSAAG